MDKREKVLYTTKYGTYYNPAGTHYSNPLANCICDHCGTENLISCIGYSDIDVCLPCVENLNTSPYRQGPSPRFFPNGKNSDPSGKRPPGVMCEWASSPY